MRGRRLLIGVALVAAGALGPATAVSASTNDVLASRVGVFRTAITPLDLAPAECAHLPLTTVVTAEPGTPGGRTRGTRGADLVLGSLGDDVLDGLAGDDCLVGGPGADELDGGPGADTCLPGEEPGDTTVRCEPGS